MNNVLISFLYIETSRPVCLAEQWKHIEGFQCFAQQILAFDEMVQAEKLLCGLNLEYT